MWNTPQRADLLPTIEVMPDQSDQPEKDGSQSKYVTSEIDLLHIIRKFPFAITW
jgi:hypothetical protein